jgi:TolA-binding protein
MLFNARINRAKTFQASGSNDTKEIKRVLTKMLKDEKNKEFLDQIYYALAEIAFKEKNDSLAVKYLKFSAALSAGNTRQRGQSYLRLADIYFAKPDYHTSQAYYDSAVAFLPKDYRNYELIMNKKNSLTNLVKNIRTIMNEDSLQKVVKMDSVQRNKIIEEIIARVIEEEKKKEEEKQKQQSGTGNTGSFYNQQQSGFGSTTTTSGAWYFYNPAAMSLGLSDFYKKWGNRTLEDNWRRELKEKISAFNEDEPEQAQGGNGNKNETKDAKKTKEYYLKNLPFTADQQARSHEKILEAYYALGSIYKEQLQDYPRSSESFEELLKRYPVNKYLLNSYYQLYRLNLLLKNNTRAEYYKNKILKEHPQTEYAKIILNPEYNKEILAARSEVEKFYTETYALYESGNYSEVIARADRADSLYSKSPMAPKFAFLRALSIGKTGQAQEYENALHKIIISYPKDEVKAKAQELLDYLTRAKNAQSNNGNSQDSLAQKIPYAYKKDAQHFCMIIADIKKIDVSDLKNKISNFNGKYFSLETFTMQTLIYEAEKELIVVKSFASADKGMNYYTTLKDNKEVFEKVSSTDYSVSVISSDNYPLLYQRKNTTDYLKFFSENYINKK